MKLPPQCPPVQRSLPMSQAYLKDAGIGAAQDPCATLPGMAQQICYGLQYGIST
jgi:hypothetical protein